ncbi:hypothetical protein CsSME_00015866 [Camellia sinensis var. sinensis]
MRTCGTERVSDGSGTDITNISTCVSPLGRVSLGAHDPADVENGICYAIEHQSSSVNTRPRLEDTIFLNKKRRKESCSGNIDWDNEINKCDGFGLKRKQCSEDVSPLKRIRMK